LIHPERRLLQPQIRHHDLDHARHAELGQPRLQHLRRHRTDTVALRHQPPEPEPAGAARYGGHPDQVVDPLRVRLPELLGHERHPEPLPSTPIALRPGGDHRQRVRIVRVPPVDAAGDHTKLSSISGLHHRPAADRGR
jgi:hypothetical protein